MRRLLDIISFFCFYVYEIVKSNFRVAHDVLTPRHRMKPGIVVVDISDMTDWQQFFMANFITMTPGTLGITLSPNRKRLYLHAMYIDKGYRAMSEELKSTYGKRVCRVFK